jgi:hypothetical protein
MAHSKVDLKREQKASMERPCYPYSRIARIFFASMDFVAGKKMTLSKAKLLEILASIPYREWETRLYARMTRNYRDPRAVEYMNELLQWGREAQDNEYTHLRVIQEKMIEDGIHDNWYLKPPLPWLIVWSYIIISRFFAMCSFRRALLFNGEFEDHAEHEYARLVAEHPEWETQTVDNPIVARYTDATTWADVFRRIGLDERDHRNRSFAYCGKSELVVDFEGMAEINETVSNYTKK